MTPFLQHIARQLVSDFGSDFGRVMVVLPSQRASLFLKKYLSEEIKKPFLLPRIITINEFVEEQTDYVFARQPELLMVLFRAYQNVENEQGESFEKFTKWGNIMLGDFNEIDRYMVDEKKILSDLSNIKEIENWSFGSEELSELQQNYLKFWNRLLLYYNEFNRLLDEEKMAYQGKVYKKLASETDVLVKKLNEEKLFFAGFSALSLSEEKILFGLQKNGIAKLFFDADSFYTLKEGHEAGFFMRKIRQQSHRFDWLTENYKEIPKKIKIWPAPGNIRMAALAGNILGELNERSEQPGTAVVLADEQLLMPVLNSLPSNTGPVNVTMGLPLRQSEYYSLVLQLLDLQQSFSEKIHRQSVYHKPLIAFFENQLVSSFSSTALLFVRNVVMENRIFVKFTDIVLPWENKDWENIFHPWEKIPRDALAGIECLNRIYTEKAQEIKNDFLLEQVHLFSILVNDLKRLSGKYPYISELKTLRHFIRQYVNNEKISFFGEPLDGVQLMGVLETRTLDFKNIILLSANEDKIPKSNFDNTFIPSDVKRLYGLPGKDEKDAVFAYHFYRLLQRAEEIHLIYNDNMEMMGGGEKSRFILQLENELPVYNSSVTIETIPSSALYENKPLRGKEITVDESLKKRIEEYFLSGVSPSALNTFINCRLDFYYKYIIGIREEEELLESADHSTAGKIIHETLEELYRPLVGGFIREENISAMAKNAAPVLEKKFNEYFKSHEGLSGKNLLIYEASRQYLESFFKTETELVKTNGAIQLIALETELKGEMEIKPLGINVKFKGIADRIDKLNNEVRIIDYKTGKFDKKELTPVAINDVFENGDYGKALQLMMYSWMYANQSGEQNIQAYIVPLRLPEKGYTGIKLDKKDNFTIQYHPQFCEQLQKLLLDIFSSNAPIHHNPESEYCIFCK